MLQNYNNILTKRTIFSIILEKNPGQDPPPPKKKKSAYFTYPDFSAGKIEKKKVRKLREQILYVIMFTNILMDKNVFKQDR
jgi:hypothetical protein